ncbi:aminopeptidase [Halobacteriovorax marinus]|uniref:Aminopeptidase n=1 Tax=Halobacteriovorax marinus TaxID=97084 RepID=A0A1Y5FHM8_9BACT|nr:aminopeptidase [Halobacteriovorax marinus]
MSLNGKEIYSLAERLFGICRSITGPGVRETLAILQEYLPKLKIEEVATGTKCFDWNIPKEWSINDAFIIGPDGNKIANLKDNNLHIVSYSIPMDVELSLEELKKHLYSLPDLPDAIPYVTSYYKETWGFCLSHNVLENLKEGSYKVVIDSKLENGVLNYGELFIQGESSEEVLFSTYVCHPSMGNNECSGPSVATALASWITNLPKRHYSYRFIFIPETIGSICYISKNLEDLQKNTIAAFNVNCVGDVRAYSFLPSIEEDSLPDNVARHVLKNLAPSYTEYSFLERGSDERQFCSPGVDIPMASIMRSKYKNYPEYHTSKDDLDFISAKGLEESYELFKHCIIILENNLYPRAKTKCEFQLSKYGLYPSMGAQKKSIETKLIWNFLAYSNGKRSLLEIAEKLKVPAWSLIDILKRLEEKSLIEVFRK